jgi:hypothetical protein
MFCNLLAVLILLGVVIVGIIVFLNGEDSRDSGKMERSVNSTHCKNHNH